MNVSVEIYIVMWYY